MTGDTGWPAGGSAELLFVCSAGGRVPGGVACVTVHRRGSGVILSVWVPSAREGPQVGM